MDGPTDYVPVATACLAVGLLDTFRRIASGAFSASSSLLLSRATGTIPSPDLSVKANVFADGTDSAVLVETRSAVAESVAVG